MVVKPWRNVTYVTVFRRGEKLAWTNLVFFLYEHLVTLFTHERCDVWHVNLFMC